MKSKYICVNCKKEFERYSTQIRNKDEACCSFTCRYEYQKLKLTGKNNPNYKDGKTINSSCICGNKKDSRSKLCAVCAKKSFLKNNEIDTRKDLNNIISIVQESTSILDTSKKIGISRAFIAKTLKKNNIDAPNFKGTKFRKLSNEQLFIKSEISRNGTISSRLKDIRGNKCEKCGIENWNNLQITIQLHHKNGNSKDNRLENLELLCPNCHSQTSNFTGKNMKRKHKSVGGKS